MGQIVSQMPTDLGKDPARRSYSLDGHPMAAAPIAPGLHIVVHADRQSRRHHLAGACDIGSRRSHRL